MKAEYAFFYLEGREAKVLRADIDTGAIAERVLAGDGTIHELLHKAASDAAKGLEVDRQKRRWISDYEEEIKEAGGDGDEAYRHYCDGRVDELVYTLEPEVVEDIGVEIGDAEDPDDDDDEDGSEDDEEDAEDEEPKA
jgi:hypothetical protein